MILLEPAPMISAANLEDAQVSFEAIAHPVARNSTRRDVRARVGFVRRRDLKYSRFQLFQTGIGYAKGMGVKLEIIPIEPEEDLDLTWLLLPDQQKWQLVRAFMDRGLRFEQRFKNPNISLRVLRDQGVFEGLPRSAERIKLEQTNER
jgi:hypothetical protein